MKLHIFNPEHDLALAANTRRFTPPHAARQLRSDLEYIPAFWAEEGDMVLVNDKAAAIQHVRTYQRLAQDVLFVTPDEIKGKLHDINELDIEPWGWDYALLDALNRLEIPASCLPTSQDIDQIRILSSREFAATHLLPRLQGQGTIGESWTVTSMDKLRDRLSQLPEAVIKAPWSSSGRGVRYIKNNGKDTAVENAAQGMMVHGLEGWCRNILHQQGALMVEPYYNKVIDFAMEFYYQNGHAKYRGLSVFDTMNGAYTGNLLASETTKTATLAKYVGENQLKAIRDNISALVSELLADKYHGPFGVDMMIVADKETMQNGQFKVHPCVELNLRRTMGHVALSLTPKENELDRVMRINYTDRFHFCLRNRQPEF